MNRKAGTLVVLALIAAISCSKSTKHEPPDYEYVRLIEGWPSWSPDGRYIAYDRPARDTIQWLRYGQISVWMYDTETGRYGFLVGPGMFPRWNPEGTILAFNWGKTIYFYYPESKSVKRVTDPGEIFAFNWSPDGEKLIFGGEYRYQTGCLVVDTLGNLIRDVIPEGWRGGGSPSFLAQGHRISLGAKADSLDESSVIIVDSLGNFLEMILTASYNWSSFGYMAWSPDETRMAINISYTIDPHVRDVEELRIYSMDGSLERILTEDAGMAQWSPDGSKIAFQKYTWMAPSRDGFEPDYGRVTVWTCNPDGSDMHELLGWPQPEYDTTMFDGGYNWLSER